MAPSTIFANYEYKDPPHKSDFKEKDFTKMTGGVRDFNINIQNNRDFKSKKVFIEPLR